MLTMAMIGLTSLSLALNPFHLEAGTVYNCNKTETMALTTVELSDGNLYCYWANTYEIGEVGSKKIVAMYGDNVIDTYHWCWLD